MIYCSLQYPLSFSLSYDERTSVVEQPTKSIVDKWSQEMLTEFLAELLDRASDESSEHMFQKKVQAFCDELRPWIDPSIITHPRAVFTLFDDLRFFDDGDTGLVKLSPEGYAFFHAWLRRRWCNPVLHGCRN